MRPLAAVTAASGHVLSAPKARATPSSVFNCSSFASRNPGKWICGYVESRTMNKRLILGSPVDEVVNRLFTQSASQTQELMDYFSARAEEPSFDWNRFDARTNQFLSDKLVALDRDKAEFCYQLCRALGARRIVEAGTSFGVSTLFLAAAVRDNVRAGGGEGVVIATEHESNKAKAARANFAEAGLAQWIDLREGDLRQTLSDLSGLVDFMLVDIWTPMARPALELMAHGLA